MVLNLGVKMLTTKYKIEDDRFLFKAIYDDELNIIYNHHEDKQTGEVFVADNLGELDGKVKFDPSTIDDYVQKAIGAAFPIMVDDVGFVFTYDDLESHVSKVINKYANTEYILDRFSNSYEVKFKNDLFMKLLIHNEVERYNKRPEMFISMFIQTEMSLCH